MRVFVIASTKEIMLENITVHRAAAIAMTIGTTMIGTTMIEAIMIGAMMIGTEMIGATMMN